MTKAYKELADGTVVELSEEELAERELIRNQVTAPTERAVRNHRNQLLNNVVDPFVSNALRWADLDSDTQTAWTTYRQALLDIPEQEGFPTNVAWPTEPAQ